MKIDNKIILENSKKLNLLYVEDDELLRNSTSGMFDNFFKSVDVAHDGADGLKKYQRYIEENGSPYDLVISDINMPNMDGLEMCEKIKEINYDQVFIFISAFNEANYLHSAIDLGAHGFLTKPIEFEQLKAVLYRSTQMITDRKLVQKHYEQMEEISIQNLQIDEKEIFSSSKDILEDLIEKKDLISDKWVEKEDVRERLRIHSIDVEFFRSHYGIKVIEYFLNVIKGKAEIGNCPVIIVMLEFFKKKNLPLEDVFLICVNFKNTVTAYIFETYGFSHKLFDEVSLILDKNFEGVVKNYQTKREKKLHPAEIKVEKVKEVVSKTEQLKNINYTEYVLENDVYELQDLEEDIDALAVLVIMNHNSTVEDNELLGNHIKRYGTILSNYPLFAKLGEYIVKLGVNFAFNAKLLFDDRQRMSNITALIEGFVNDLIIWRKEIFENNREDSHFLDDSFFSNVDTIIMFIEYNEADCLEPTDEIEFF